MEASPQSPYTLTNSFLIHFPKQNWPQLRKVEKSIFLKYCYQKNETWSKKNNNTTTTPKCTATAIATATAIFIATATATGTATITITSTIFITYTNLVEEFIQFS